MRLPAFQRPQFSRPVSFALCLVLGIALALIISTGAAGCSLGQVLPFAATQTSTSTRVATPTVTHTPVPGTSSLPLGAGNSSLLSNLTGIFTALGVLVAILGILWPSTILLSRRGLLRPINHKPSATQIPISPLIPDAPPEAPKSIFISYSRTDSTFVDRLERDLLNYGFHPWVDRSEIPGGKDWMKEIQRAIDDCQVLLVVLSPDAVASEYVPMEYRHALRKKKQTIPLDYRPVQDVPMDLPGLQWVNFQNAYEDGLKKLLAALRK